MKWLPQRQRLCEVWCVFTDKALWQVRGTLTGKYGVLCRRPYCHWTAERQCKRFICSSLRGTDENQHLEEPEPLFSEVTLLRPSFKQEKWNRLREFSNFQHQSIPKMVSALTKTWVLPEPGHRLCSQRHNAALGWGSEIRMLVNENSPRTGTNEITGRRPRLCQNSGWRFCLGLSQTGWLSTCIPRRLWKRENCERGKKWFLRTKCFKNDREFGLPLKRPED